MSSHMLGDFRVHAQYNTRHRYVVLLVHEGGPENLSYAAVASFLASELSSRRAVDSFPRWMWLPVLYGMVLPWRTPRTRKLYEASWLPRGNFATLNDSASLPGSSWLSRLLKLVLRIPGVASRTHQQLPHRRAGGTVSVYHCQQLAEHVQGIIAQVYADHCERAGRPLIPGEVSIQVEVGYTHQKGSLDASLGRVHLLGNYTGVRDSKTRPACIEEEHLIVFPLYPQYSSLRSAAAFDALARTRFLTEKRSLPHMEFIRSYAGHPAYVKAMEMHIREYMGKFGSPDWLFVVFDGLPKRFVLSGDIYQVECQRTYDALKELLSKPYTPPCDRAATNGICNGDATGSSASPSSPDTRGRQRSTDAADRAAQMYTRPFLSSRLTVSFLSGPVGVEEALEPRTTRVLNSLAKQVRVIESNARREALARTSRSASREPSVVAALEAESSRMRKAMMGSIYFVCPGIVIDDIRSQTLVHSKLVTQSLACGWDRATVIPSLNGSELHAEMLANIISQYIR